MANPTTNYGWVMPAATDLVTDLPADFNTFGQGVDTSMAQLLGGTTGQILSKTSATNMAFTWTTPNPGDITGVTAGTGISGGGTSGDVTVTNSMATAITTSGDLVQGTGSGTFARLATGTNGQYLTTNGTTNSWASPASGSFTKIASGTITAASSWNIGTAFSATYRNYYVVITGGGSAQNLITARMRVGGVDNSNGSYSNGAIGRDTADSTVGYANGSGSTSFKLGRVGTLAGGGGRGFIFNCLVSDPFVVQETQLLGTITGFFPLTGGANMAFYTWGGNMDDATSFDSMSFIMTTGTFTGKYYVYGLEN